MLARRISRGRWVPRLHGSAGTHPPGPELTVWPVENDGFGIDARWSGADGPRATVVTGRLLEQAGVKARLTQHVDGRGWELRVGPVPGADVARTIDEFVLVKSGTRPLTA